MEFYDCYSFTGQPSDVESAGGTSESAPFVSGAAALIIQAYRDMHGGTNPTPEQVKLILTSSASDLGAPAVEQGAGLLNTYQAVLLAESLPGSTLGVPFGNTIMVSTDQPLSAIGKPGSNNHWTVTIANTGANAQTVKLSGRTLGPNQNVQTGIVTLIDGTSPELVSWGGALENYTTFTFNVPPGVDRLDASLAYPPGGGATVHLSLVDPQGRYAANSLPQGVSDYASVDVIAPAPGVWTGAIYSALASSGGINGTIPWQVETQNFVSFAKVTPSSLKLAAGETKTVTVAAADPPSPGDLAGSIVVTPSLGTPTSIPVTLRSLVQPSMGGGFSGVLTGGNGRPPGEGQVEYYEFNVPKGVRNITTNVTLASDAGDNVGTYLIGPDGDTLGYGQNDLNGNVLSATAYTLNPVPGLWTLVIDLQGAIVGDEISVPYSGNVLFNNVIASVTPTLPKTAAGHHLAAGTAVPFTVNITNNGATPQYFFIDARLNSSTDLALATQFGTSGTVSLPTTSYPLWLVPSQTSIVSLTVTASLPVTFDFSPVTGDPDRAGGSCTETTSMGSYESLSGTVTSGFWYAFPDECGPYSAPEPAGTASMTMTATAKAFDAAVTSDTSDFWITAVNPSAGFSPIQINPGASATINVTITPSGPSGTVVSGSLYVDVFVEGVPPYGQDGGDELVVFPYEYTIK